MTYSGSQRGGWYWGSLCQDGAFGSTTASLQSTCVWSLRYRCLEVRRSIQCKNPIEGKAQRLTKELDFLRGIMLSWLTLKALTPKSLQYIQKDSQQIWCIYREPLGSLAWNENNLSWLFLLLEYGLTVRLSTPSIDDVVVKYQSIEYSILRIHAWYLPWYKYIRISIFLSISLPSKSSQIGFRPPPRVAIVGPKGWLCETVGTQSWRKSPL